MTGDDLERVLVWKAGDPRERVHLAPADWRLVGMTLCGRSIKQAADAGEREPCPECWLRSGGDPVGRAALIC